MPERNASIAAILDEIADLLDIQGANPFRVRAYRNAARGIGDLGTEVDVLMERGTPLTDIPGIGEDLAKKIVEILQTGTCEFLERLHRELPREITELLKIPALGPRRVKTLYQDLHIENLEQLLEAAKAGHIRSLPGFGEKTERRLLEAAQGRIAKARRFPLVAAAGYAEPLANYLREAQDVSRVEIAGSYRRMRSTVGDIDVVAIAGEGASIMDRLVNYPEVARVLSKGPTRSSVVLASGMQVDLRSLPAESFGAAMVYFTGSKAHNIAIRRMGQERGLKINEYGVFREDFRIAGDTEESVYGAIDLPWIAPELREDRGEIEAAQAGKLPNLVQLSDLRGDLFVYSATTEDVEARAQAAQERGLQYIAILADEGAASDTKRLEHELGTLERLNRDSSAPAVLKAIEVGIGPDGILSVPDSLLPKFDMVVVAVHTDLDLQRERQTGRIVKALQHPRVAMLAQPLQSDGAQRFDVDFAAVVHQAKERDVALLVTLHPRRIAIPDIYLEVAKREGARVIIASEAGSAEDLSVLRFSVGFAGRAGLEASNILNTSSVDVLLKWLRTRATRMSEH